MKNVQDFKERICDKLAGYYANMITSNEVLSSIGVTEEHPKYQEMIEVIAEREAELDAILENVVNEIIKLI